MKKLDNIEDGFKDKFDHNNVTNEGWNAPSDNIWNKIDSELSEESEESRGYVYYMILSIICVSFLGLVVFYNFNDSSKAVKEVNQITKPFIENQSSQNLTENSIISPSDLQSTLETEKKQKFTTTIESNSNSRYYSQTEFSNKNKKSQASTILPKSRNIGSEINRKPNIIASSINYADNSITTEKISISNSSRNLVSIPTLERLNPELEKQFRALPQMTLTGSIIPLKKESSNRSYVSINARIGIVDLHNSGSQETALSELIDDEYGSQDLQLSIQYGRQVSSKINVSFGISIRKQSFVTEYDVTLPYDTNQEIIENGSAYIDFEHSLPTSFGNTDTGLRLLRTRASEPLMESDVKLDFDTEHSFSIISLPLKVNYQFSNHLPGLSLGFIAAPSYIIGAKSGIHSAISQHSDILSTNNHSTSDYKTLTKANLNVGVDLNYNFSISKSNSIGFSLGYWQNVNSHFSTDNFSSRMSGVTLGVEYLYSF